MLKWPGLGQVKTLSWALAWQGPIDISCVAELAFLGGRTSYQYITTIVYVLDAGQVMGSPLPQPFAVSIHHPEALFFSLIPSFLLPSILSFCLHAPFYSNSCEFSSRPFPFFFMFLWISKSILHFSTRLFSHLHPPDKRAYILHPTYFSAQFWPVFPIPHPHRRHSCPSQKGCGTQERA